MNYERLAQEVEDLRQRIVDLRLPGIKPSFPFLGELVRRLHEKLQQLLKCAPDEDKPGIEKMIEVNAQILREVAAEKLCEEVDASVSRLLSVDAKNIDEEIEVLRELQSDLQKHEGERVESARKLIAEILAVPPDQSLYLFVTVQQVFECVNYLLEGDGTEIDSNLQKVQVLLRDLEKCKNVPEKVARRISFARDRVKEILELPEQQRATLTVYRIMNKIRMVVSEIHSLLLNPKTHSTAYTPLLLKLYALLQEIGNCSGLTRTQVEEVKTARKLYTNNRKLVKVMRLRNT